MNKRHKATKTTLRNLTSASPASVPNLPSSGSPTIPNLQKPNQTYAPPPNSGSYSGDTSVPNMPLNESEIEIVVREAANSVAQKMGLSVVELSAEMMEAIRTASINALNTRTRALVHRDVDAAAKATLLRGTKPLDVFNDRVTAAMEGISYVAQDAKVDSVLNDTARLLWKKFQALKNSGFNEEQAFELVLAEVQGRASRNK